MELRKCKICGDIFEQENIYQETCPYCLDKEEEKYDNPYLLSENELKRTENARKRN